MMMFSRVSVLTLTLLVTLFLVACGGGSSSSSKSPPVAKPPAGKTPVARNDSASTATNTPVTITVLANDSGGNGAPFEVQIGTNPTKGKVNVNSQNDVVTYTPNKGVTGSDSFKYSFTDSKGVSSNQALVDITIKSSPPAGKTPVARNDSVSTAVDTPVEITVLANDSGGNGAPFEVRIEANPTKGSVHVNSQSDVVTYTPNKGVTGSDSFKYSFTDSKGVRSNTAMVNVTFACPAIHPNENYMAIGDSLTSGTGDDITADNVTADGCYKGRGYPSVLVDKLNKAKGRKHTVVNEGVPGARSLDGSRSVGDLLGRESMHYLALYGTNDSNGAAEGNGVPPNQFRTNMQEIIDQIHARGKNVYLAKIPPVLGEQNTGIKYKNLDQGARNKLIIEYNKVIDDLVRKNGINVTPPDFYNFYKSRQYLYSDNVHMNGKGYQSMADQWFQKLKSL